MHVTGARRWTVIDGAHGELLTDSEEANGLRVVKASSSHNTFLREQVCHFSEDMSGAWSEKLT